MKFRKLLVLCALLLTGSGVAKAVDANVWQKPTIPSEVALENGGTYYFLNVGSGLFFTQGNAWGTQASVGESGLKVRVEETANAGIYTLTDYVKTQSAWKMWWFVDDANDPTMYVDYNGQANYLWIVMDMGNKVYRIGPAASNPFAFGEDMYVGLDRSEDAARTYLTWNNKPDGPAFIDWKLISEEDGDAYETAISVYKAAQELLALLQEAEEIKASVDDQLAVYNNTASTLEDLQQAITDVKAAIEKRKEEMAAENYENATVENPVDVTSLFIKNPSYENNKNDGWEGSTPGFQSYTNAEFYQSVFDTHQSMTGLLEGVYMLGLQAFYRPGWGDGSGYTAYVNKDAQIYDVKMYANSGAKSYSTPIVTAYEGAGEKIGRGSETAVTTAEGTTIYIPNDMNSAAGYFAAGRYYNSTLFEADADNTITIGLKNSKSVGGNWVIYDNWRLVYMGAGEDAYAALAKNIATTLPDYSNIDENTVYTPSYLEAYNAAKASLADATGKDGIKAAIAAAQESAAAFELNIELWQKYQDLCKKAMQVAGNEDYNESAREPLADYEMDLKENLNARSMTNEELQALCDEIETAIDNAIRTPKDGADVTSYLVNADFSTNDDTGWTGRSSITDIAHSCAEAYEKKNFDLYQVVKDAPLGVYEISLKGFFRNGPNDAAWPAYRDNGAPEATAFVYMNQKQTPLKNCYDHKFPHSAFDLSEGHIYGPTPYALLDAAGDSLRNEAGESLWVPNGMSTSQDVFDTGAYMSSAFGLVAKVGDEMRIGIKGSLGSSCWAIWDDFRLTYRGFQRDVVLEVLNEEIANTEAYKSLLIGKNVRDIIAAKLAAAVAAKEFEKGQDMFGALTDLFTVGDTVRASEAIFAELETAYEKLAAAIPEAKADNETILKATNLQNDIYNNVFAIEPADVQWTDEQAQATIAEIEQMIKDLATPGDFANASDANPKDATWYVENPKYAENNNTGWTSKENPGFGSNLCEMWNKPVFDYYQDLTGLLEGTYELTVQGFYRAGGNYDADNDAYMADPTANNNLEMYVKVGDNQVTATMPRLCNATEPYTSTKWNTNEDGSPKLDDNGNKTFWSSDDNNWQWVWAGAYTVAEDGESATGQRACNGMATAAEMFSKGHYLGTSITFKPDAEGKVRIGLQKTAAIDNDWCIWSNWTLTYYGKNSSKPETGIAAPFSNSQVVRTEFFNLNGARINAPRSGVMIIKQTMADGTVKVRKAVVK